MSCLVKKICRKRVRNKMKKCDEKECAAMSKKDIQAEYDQRTDRPLHLDTHNAFELRNEHKGPRIEII